MWSRRASIVGLAIAMLLATAVGAQAQPPKAVIGSDGTIYRLLRGAYGGLFPEGTEAVAGDIVLALDVVSPLRTDRLLVPGTDRTVPEGETTLVYEDSTDSVFLLWEGLFNGIHPLVYLASYDGSNWSPVVELASSPFSQKGDLQMVVTRDTAPALKADSSDTAPELTVVHAVWWEETPSGVSRKRYAPVFIENGTYLGWTPVMELADLAPDVAKSASNVLTPGASNLLRVQRGLSNRAIVIGFLNSATEHVSTVGVEVLPRELSELMQKMRAAAIGIGMRMKSRPEFAAEASGAAYDLASAFHSAARRYFASRTYEVIAGSTCELDPAGVESLADELVDEFLRAGARIADGGLESSGDPRLLQIGQSAEESLPPYHHLKVTVLSDREAPEVGDSAQIFLSESGRDVLIAWPDEDGVSYVESDGEGWSAPAYVGLDGDSLDRDNVLQMLAARVRGR